MTIFFSIHSLSSATLISLLSKGSAFAMRLRHIILAAAISKQLLYGVSNESTHLKLHCLLTLLSLDDICGPQSRRVSSYPSRNGLHVDAPISGYYTSLTHLVFPSSSIGAPFVFSSTPMKKIIVPAQASNSSVSIRAWDPSSMT